MKLSQAIVAEARRWEGTPYRHQAACRGVGSDCLGLVRGVWRALYGPEPFEVPPYDANPLRHGNISALQTGFDTWLNRLTSPPGAGDVLLFRIGRNTTPRHCAIMLEDGVFLHAQERLGTVRACLNGPWQRRLVASYSYPIPQAAGTRETASMSHPTSQGSR